MPIFCVLRIRIIRLSRFSEAFKILRVLDLMHHQQSQIEILNQFATARYL